MAPAKKKATKTRSPSTPATTKLSTYQRKRDFAETPEPSGAGARRRQATCHAS